VFPNPQKQDFNGGIAIVFRAAGGGLGGAALPVIKLRVALKILLKRTPCEACVAYQKGRVPCHQSIT
jgi:hypothetical protein